MPCDLCPNFLKIFRFNSSTQEKENEMRKEISTPIVDKSCEEQHAIFASKASVAPCGDVMAEPSEAPLQDFQDSEVEDFESWNEEALDEEADIVSVVTKGDPSTYNTAELDEAIFGEKTQRCRSTTVGSRQSEKDFDSIVDFWSNSEATDGVPKYFDSTQNLQNNEEEKEPCVTEYKQEQNFRQILEMTKDLATLQLEELSWNSIDGIHPMESREGRMNNQIVINSSEHSSVTTETVANLVSCTETSAVEPPTHLMEDIPEIPLERENTLLNYKVASFLETQSQVTKDGTQEKFSESDAAKRRDEEEDDVSLNLTESQSTQTDDPCRMKKLSGNQSQKRLWTRRRTRNIANWLMTESTGTTPASGGLTRGGAGKARVRCNPGCQPRLPVPFSLYAFVKNCCCRGMRPSHFSGLPVNKRKKRQRRPFPLNLGGIAQNQWPPNSLFHTALCGSFRIVEQSKMRSRHDHKKQPAIAIPFLFGIQSADVLTPNFGDTGGKGEAEADKTPASMENGTEKTSK